MTNVLPAGSTTCIIREAPKTLEAKRQVERLFASYASACGVPRESVQMNDSLQKAVTLIQSFISSPYDVPIAGTEDDGTPALFIKADGIYGDLTIEDGALDYYLRVMTTDGEFEEHGVEQIDGARMPAGLLVKLARSVAVR